MVKIDRTAILKNYPTICYQINAMQKACLDDNLTVEEKRIYDALPFPTKVFPSVWFGSMVKSNDLNEHAKNLAEKLHAFLKFVGTEELIILSHLKINFFGNLQHDYHKVKNAYKTLSKYIGKKTYDEALILKTDALDDFVEIFFWLERCDPSIPEYVFWFDKEERYCFYFCKYGNVHFTDFTCGNLINETALENLGFIIDDFDQFGQNAIEGRVFKF